MSNMPFQAVYDVNTPGNPYHPELHKYPNHFLDRLSGLPIDTPQLPLGTEALPLPPSNLLTRLSAFFRPRNASAAPDPFQANKIFGNTMIIPAVLH